MINIVTDPRLRFTLTPLRRSYIQRFLDFILRRHLYPVYPDARMAVQEAVNLGLKTGETVYFPPGQYFVDRTITL